MPELSILRTCLALPLAACTLLAGCSNFSGMVPRVSGILTPYKVEVVQGNFVSREQVEALKAGMSRQQVRDVLGSPLLTSLFHADRWEYVFLLKRQGVEPQARKLTVYFNGEVLARFEGDAMPSEAEFVAQLDTRRKVSKPPVLELTPDQLKPAADAPAESGAANPNAGAAPAAAASYPPLESPAR